MAQAIRLRVRNHDAYQLEFKNDYHVVPGKRTRYTIDIYLFVPQSLDINQRTYSQADFYRDAKNYVRLRTPRLSLRDMADKSSSPLVNCEHIVQTPNWQHNEKLRAQLVNSLKVMRPVLNASLRAHVRRLAAVVAPHADGPNRVFQANKLVEELLDRTGNIAERYRALLPHLLEAGRKSRVVAVHRLTDEAISLVIENALTQAFQILGRVPDQAVAAYQQEQIGRQNGVELSYRREQGYGTILNAEDDNRAFLRRASLLKKFTTSVLFLTTSVGREGTFTEQVTYAVAAGLSMVFATIVAFYSQTRFGMLTFPLFVALVVAYMFKDRIKELARVLFARYVRRYFYDQRTILRTTDGQHRLGHIREKVDFVAHEDVPPSVVNQRNRLLPEGIWSTGLEEQILHYSKQVVIDKGAFHRIDLEWLEISGIRDIMRYDVRPYLRKMATPLRPRRHLVGSEVQIVSSHKTYEIYTVIEYESSDGEERSRRTLTAEVCLDRNGIQDIQLV